MTAEIASLRHIWHQAFGDPEETLDAFFTTGFSTERCHYILDKGVPVSALYWFDCTLQGKKLAYFYAVATEETHRGKGLARRLMEETHGILQAQGYAGAILVPGEKGLFHFYEKLGYRTATSVREFIAEKGEHPVPLQKIDTQTYANLRRQYLPAGGVEQAGAALDFLSTQADFYAGEDFLLAASIQGDTLTVQELLGNANAAPGILRALQLSKGIFRTPGNDRAFAMFLPLCAGCPEPDYFGLALD